MTTGERTVVAILLLIFTSYIISIACCLSALFVIYLRPEPTLEIPHDWIHMCTTLQPVYPARIETAIVITLIPVTITFTPSSSSTFVYISTSTPTDTLKSPSTITLTPTPVCECYEDLYNCEEDFISKSQAQLCFDYCISKGFGDIHQLDSDNDSDACEELK